MEKEKSEKAFSNWRPGAVHLTFPNGNWLSTTWARWSYSDNHEMELDLSDGKFTHMESNTCEVMFDCPEKLSKRIFKFCGENPTNGVIGYLTMEQWLRVVEMLAKPPKN